MTVCGFYVRALSLSVPEDFMSATLQLQAGIWSRFSWSYKLGRGFIALFLTTHDNFAPQACSTSCVCIIIQKSSLIAHHSPTSFPHQITALQRRLSSLKSQVLVSVSTFGCLPLRIALFSLLLTTNLASSFANGKLRIDFHCIKPLCFRCRAFFFSV